MFKSQAQILIALVCLLESSRAFAFLPALFGAAEGVKEGVDALSSLSDASAEVTGTIDAMENLYTEIGGDVEVTEETKRTISLIQEIKTLANEAGASADEIDALTYNRDVASLRGAMNALTQAIRAGKNAGRLFMKVDRKAQVAEIETNAIEKQQLAVQRQILEIQVQSMLEKKRDELKKILEIQTLIKKKEDYVKKYGGFEWGKVGLYSFPKSNETLKKATDVAKTLVPYLMLALCPIFLARLIYNQVRFSDPSKYDEQLVDTFVTAFLLCIFPVVVGYTLEVAEALASAISHTVVIRTSAPDVPSKASILEYMKWVTYFWTFLKTGLFWLTQLLFTFGIAFCIVLFPFAIFKSKMMGTALSLETFFSIFVGLCLWPVYWHMIGLIATTLCDKQDLADKESFTAVLFSLVQFASPFLVNKFMMGASPAESAMNMTKTLGGVPAQLGGFMTGVLKGKSDGSGGGHLGKATRYGFTQVGGRSASAVKRGAAEYQAAGSVGRGLAGAASGALMNSSEVPTPQSNRGRVKSALDTGSRFVDGFKMNPGRGRNQ